jgi:hypothetical protein
VPEPNLLPRGQLLDAIAPLGLAPDVAGSRIDSPRSRWPVPHHLGRQLRPLRRALALIGYLVYRSGFAPRLLGVLLVSAGLGYLVDEIGSVLVSGYALEISRFSFVGEAVLIFWLLIKGVRLHGSGTR